MPSWSWCTHRRGGGIHRDARFVPTRRRTIRQSGRVPPCLTSRSSCTSQPCIELRRRPPRRAAGTSRSRRNPLFSSPDIWAMGVTLYNVVYGTCPFDFIHAHSGTYIGDRYLIQPIEGMFRKTVKTRNGTMRGFAHFFAKFDRPDFSLLCDNIITTLGASRPSLRSAKAPDGRSDSIQTARLVLESIQSTKDLERRLIHVRRKVEEASGKR